MPELIETVKLFLLIVEIFFIVYLVIYSTYLFISAIVGSITLYKERYNRILHNNIKHKDYFPISVLVPAYNEEVTIIESVESLLKLDYSLYEIIIINDGSEDKTKDKLIEVFKLEQMKIPIRNQLKTQPIKACYITNQYKVPIILIDKENGGKSDALNAGINVSSFPYFVTMDADSILQKDSLEMLIRPILEDSKIIACGGLVRLNNGAKFQNGNLVSYRIPNNLLVGMQILEYDRSFLASRILLDQFNGNLIISGAFGLFKKEYVVVAGGYDSNTLGEDFELVIKLHTFAIKNHLPYKIKYVPSAVCWTQGPSKLGDLVKQRRRWYLGLFQNMIKYRKMFLNLEYGFLSFISYSYFLFFELLSPYIELFGTVSMIIAYLFGLLNIKYMVLFYGIYCLFGVVLSLTIFIARVHLHDIKLRVIDFFKAVLAAVSEVLFLRFFLTLVRVTSLIGYRKKRLKWGKFKRNEIENIS